MGRVTGRHCLNRQFRLREWRCDLDRDVDVRENR